MSGKPIIIIEREGSKIWQLVSVGIARIPTFWLSIWILCVPLFLLLPSIRMFPYPASGSPFSDLTITHYPNALFLKSSITTWREIPLWSSTILSGYPFVANPLSGLWYPFGWIALITPLPLGFNLLIGVHLIWGGLGMYKLMNEEGLGHAAALFAGIAFALLPKFFAHYGAGHLTLLYAVPWTPWLLWSQRSEHKRRDESKALRIPPGLILAIIFVADIRWGAFALVLWWAYSIVHRRRIWGKLFLNLSIQTGLALLLAAPLVVPLIEFSGLSTRSMLGANDVLIYSLPLINLLGILFPNTKGYHEWVLYSGGIVFTLAIVGFLGSRLRRNTLLWMGITLASVIVALGTQIPGSELLAELPFISMLRVPSRVLFLTGLSLAALAGYGVEAIIQRSKMDQIKRINIFLYIVLISSILLTIGLYLLEGDVPGGFLWGTAGLILGVVWIGAGVNSKLPVRIWIAGAFLVAVLDLAVIDVNSFQVESAVKVFAEREAVAQYISAQPGEFRTYSPSYSIPQQTAVRFGNQLADGVDPMQISRYAEFMDGASGVPREGYSVTVPPFANGDPGNDNISYSPDAEKLGLLNVGYVVADYEISADGLIHEKQIGEVHIYKNEYQMPRSWVKVEDDEFDSGIVPATILENSPNRMRLSAVGPGKLTVSEVYYPGWRVEVNGMERELSVSDGVLMAVELDPGLQEIEFSFRPNSITVGIFLFSLGLIGLLGNFWYLNKYSIWKEFKPNQNLQL